MKLQMFFSVALVLLACSYQSALAQNGPEGICPVISVSQVEAASTALTLIYNVNVQGGDPSVTPKFNWTVSPGKIIGGQGTSGVSVDPQGNKSIDVTVEVIGYAADCQNKAGYARLVEGPISNVFDEYGDLKFNEERLRLDKFAIALHNEPSSKGYIFVFDATDTRKSVARERGERAKNYLVKERGLPEAQIEVVTGGDRNKLMVMLLITPAALPPK